MPATGIQTSHIAFEALWKCREYNVSLPPPELEHLRNCDECLGLLWVCYLSDTVEDAKGFQHVESKLPY